MGNSSSLHEDHRKTIFFTASDIPKLNGPELQLSKQLLDFHLGDEPCPINHPVADELEITNVSRKKVKFKFDPVYPNTCQLTFSPTSGTISPNKSKKVKIKLVILNHVNLNFPVTLRVEGGDSLFINLRVAGEAGVFGVEPQSLETTDDDGHKIPVVLAKLKRALIHLNGINSEGIFRLAGEQSEIQRVKELLNTKKFDEYSSTRDVNCVASLIKIWFRDLPVPILNALPQERIMNWSDTSDCVDAYNTLPEPQKPLLDWLLDFLSQVSANSEVNKMTSQNLAIVVAPNLYDISTPNPLEGLVLSQKCAQFLNHVLNSHIQNRNA